MIALKLQLQKSAKSFSSNKNDIDFKATKSFSLVEVTLALFILITGLTALFMLVNSYIYTLKTIKDRTTANFLAQEGLELALAKRNSNFITLNDSNPNNNKSWLDGLGEKICINPELKVKISNLPCKFYLDEGNAESDKPLSALKTNFPAFFTHTINSNPTIFSRIIEITPLDNASDLLSSKAVKVEAKVEWSGNPVILKMVMTKWHPLAQ